MSEANFIIFKQLRFLKDVVGKPLLVFGDMNMTSEQIAESGVFELLGFDMIILKPNNVTSTMHRIPDRVIDLVMVEPCIAHIIHDLKADVSTPFLHLGLEAKISARPKAEKILVLVSPKALPHEEALKKYESLDDFENRNHTEKLTKRPNTCSKNIKRERGLLF